MTHDKQVAAFLKAAEPYCHIQDVGDGEFIIDGVVNIREALDAAISASECEPDAKRSTHHEVGEFGEGATVICDTELSAHRPDRRIIADSECLHLSLKRHRDAAAYSHPRPSVWMVFPFIIVALYFLS